VSAAYEVIVIGTGPAGLAAAQLAAEHKARTLVLDEQRAPGGQIYRAIEATTQSDRPELGESYFAGRALVQGFRDAAVDYLPGATVWQVSRDREVGYSLDGEARILSAPEIILATGAQERPFPVPGWTLPGVMTVGGAQVLLKDSALGMENAVFAGSGPLLYLVVHQYLQAGLPVKAVIDLTPRRNYWRALPRLPGALPALSKLLEGWRWKRGIAAAGVPVITEADDLRILGERVATGIDYHRNGAWTRLDCDQVLLHQGVVPNVNISLAAGCEGKWDAIQLCWTIAVDDWFQTSRPGLSLPGDGASIGGGLAARHSGRIAALAALARLGKISAAERDRLAKADRAALAAERRLRRFLDEVFRPADSFRLPRRNDDVVCRCEEVTLGQLREAFEGGCADPNQLKSFTRCGMGPCQGRFCGLTLCELVAEWRGSSVEEVGHLRLRTPIKPLALTELANLKTGTED
jgi:NADPH-dependent 2,4-dienoyl-CoA reductase/sulfur reductase-like enzyme